MAKKNKLPKWLVESAHITLNGKAYDAAWAEANEKHTAPDTEAAVESWHEAKAAWERAHPFPGIHDEARIARDALVSRLCDVGYKAARKIIKRARAGEFTAEQLLKAVEDFK